MKPKVSIMIPTYNQEKYIGQAIKSALSQPYPNLEIIISDDCSTDSTEEVVKPFLSDKRVKYFKNEQNLGMLGNYPKMLYTYASGKYVLNVDGDDWLFKTDFISKAVNMLENNENISCVLGDRKNYYVETGKFKTFSNKGKLFVKKIMDGNEFFINMPKIGYIFSHFSSIYRRDLALELDFYNKDILSFDSESISKLYIGHQVAYLPISVGAWRAHVMNSSHKDIENKIKSIKKYDYLYDFAVKKNIFDKKTLDDWRIRNQANTWSQDIIFYIQNFDFVQGIKFILKMFKTDFRLANIALGRTIIKVFNKLLLSEK